jgi:hypothetical protein
MGVPSLCSSLCRVRTSVNSGDIVSSVATSSTPDRGLGEPDRPVVAHGCLLYGDLERDDQWKDLNSIDMTYILQIRVATLKQDLSGCRRRQ